ncbi:MAG: hypothetical protein N2690_00430 [Rhodocyclaceae bacterium]|nr:hypothetical protein [Rhodocyclaceae bacterium]
MKIYVSFVCPALDQPGFVAGWRDPQESLLEAATRLVRTHLQERGINMGAFIEAVHYQAGGVRRSITLAEWIAASEEVQA